MTGKNYRHCSRSSRSARASTTLSARSGAAWIVLKPPARATSAQCAIGLEGGKSIEAGLDALYVDELVSHGVAIAPRIRIAPGDDRAIGLDGGKSISVGVRADLQPRLLKKIYNSVLANTQI